MNALRLLMIVSVLSLAVMVMAGDPPLPAEAFVVKAVQEPIHTVDPIYRAYVIVGAETFSFFVPQKFRMGGDTIHGHLNLHNIDADVVITFAFLDRASPASQTRSPEYYQAAVANRYAGGKIGDKIDQPILGHSAAAFDVEWKNQMGQGRKTRVAFVSTAVGTLELTVTSDAANFPAALTSFNAVTGSLMASVNGHLNVAHIQTGS